MFLTFVRLLPHRLAEALTLFAEAVADARALQIQMSRRHPQGFDS